VRDIDGIIYKLPTYAHAIFEREELTELTWRAVDFFGKLKPKTYKKHALLLDLWSFTFKRIENKLAPWWDNELSCLFQEIYPEKGEN